MATEGAFEGCAAIGVAINEGVDWSGIGGVHESLLSVSESEIGICNIGCPYASWKAPAMHECTSRVLLA